MILWIRLWTELTCLSHVFDSQLCHKAAIQVLDVLQTGIRGIDLRQDSKTLVYREDISRTCEDWNAVWKV